QTVLKEGKTRNGDQTLQEFWNKFKRPNLRLIGIEKVAEIQANGTNNLFSEIIAKKNNNA
ncbi:hypothetical protein, partial [Escherichia coli]|uniref:hypothetical protein n=1 Tax=Escherichia coli TaxID=562 RepID=UPI003B794C89